MNRNIIDEAYHFLGYKMRSISEMREHLKKKGYEFDKIEETISELCDSGYLNDADYIVNYASYSIEKGRGKRRILIELLQKGIDRQLAENVIEDYIYDNEIDEIERAARIARMEFEKKYDSEISDKESIYKLKIKIMGKLDRLGFEYDAIRDAVGEMENWVNMKEQSI